MSSKSPLQLPRSRTVEVKPVHLVHEDMYFMYLSSQLNNNVYEYGLLWLATKGFYPILFFTTCLVRCTDLSAALLLTCNHNKNQFIFINKKSFLVLEECKQFKN